MQLETGRPMRGIARKRIEDFLRRCGLDYDPNVSYTAALMEDDEIIATGSLDGATLKCIAVAPEHQGEDLCARIVTELRREAFERDEDHLMLFTKPQNQMLFRDLGFYPLSRTADCLLMENRRDGLADFLEAAKGPETEGTTGCIVANCNPFTLGHRYLVETAAKQCDRVYLFILSERRGMFTPAERLELAKQGCADLKNVIVRPSGPYMVSSATFPTYFIKDKARTGEIFCALDVQLFGERIAPALGVTRRFLGEEPLCPVTRQYNAALINGLPRYGIECTVIPRKESGSEAISASRVRALLEEGRISEIEALVPPTTFAFLRDRQK